ncbi:MAG: 2Fe-2S iron-sulfur cluster-binding protein [Thermoanaerobaculia bacterium]
MAAITFTPLSIRAEARDEETILDVARRSQTPLGSACGGIGVCARCRVRIVNGAEHLTGPTTIEKRVAGERDFAEDERLACQAIVKGDCSVTTTYWG